MRIPEKGTTMLQRLVVALGLMLAVVLVPPAAHAEDAITIRIDKHARLTSDGQLIFTAHVRCGPLPGTEEFTEAFTGAGQERTGAWSESGLGGTVICDGVERTHTGALFAFESAWKRGPAGVSVTIITCRLVGEEQLCFNASAARGVIVSRP
jgi:hypothetical protein